MSGRATARETFHHGAGTVIGGMVLDAGDPLVAAFPDFFRVEAGPEPVAEVAPVAPVVGRPRGRARASASEQGDGGDSE